MNLSLIEKLLFSLVLGAIFPLLGFLAGWWGTFSFLTGGLSILIAVVGLLVGIVVDIVYLKKWVSSAYSLDLKIWMAIYIFYSIGMFGMFMGLPVFNLLLALPASLFMGSKLAHQRADDDELRRMSGKVCLFTTGVLAVLCAASAAIALTDPYTAGDVQGMLGLPFEVTRPMLAGISVIGGAGLLLLQWLTTGFVTWMTYAIQKKAAGTS